MLSSLAYVAADSRAFMDRSVDRPSTVDSRTARRRILWAARDPRIRRLSSNGYLLRSPGHLGAESGDNSTLSALIACRSGHEPGHGGAPLRDHDHCASLASSG